MLNLPIPFGSVEDINSTSLLLYVIHMIKVDDPSMRPDMTTVCIFMHYNARVGEYNRLSSDQ